MKYVDYVRGKTGKPIVNITHQEAETHCKAAGGRLPTMAEAYYFRALETENNCRDNLDEWTLICENGHNLRGGSWSDYSWVVRASDRIRLVPSFRYSNIGFRCIFDRDNEK